MRRDLTDITLVIDRSGSMQSIKSDAEGGINAFIEQQKQEPREANVTLVQFDNKYEFVHSGVPIRQVPPFKLVPRGSTALLDAVGRAINETGARLGALDESQRPGLVVFVIVTDGEENSSHEFSREQIREMVEHQQSVYNWRFTFLAANQDAFAAGGSMGIDLKGIAEFSPRKVKAVFSRTSDVIARMRNALDEGTDLDNKFTDEERNEML
ncbi:MAG: VWA domain-containing protein [Planctomyces sp.]|nr:VWA domain-containing protein [Planctomyces sp.]